MLSKPCPLCYTRHAMGTPCDNHVGNSIMAAARPKATTRTTIHDGPAYRLSVDLTQTDHGVDVRFISFVPTARDPHEHTKLKLLLTHDELAVLQRAIEKVITK